MDRYDSIAYELNLIVADKAEKAGIQPVIEITAGDVRLAMDKHWAMVAANEIVATHDVPEEQRDTIARLIAWHFENSLSERGV